MLLYSALGACPRAQRSLTSERALYPGRGPARYPSIPRWRAPPRFTSHSQPLGRRGAGRVLRTEKKRVVPYLHFRRGAERRGCKDHAVGPEAALAPLGSDFRFPGPASSSAPLAPRGAGLRIDSSSPPVPSPPPRWPRPPAAPKGKETGQGEEEGVREEGVRAGRAGGASGGSTSCGHLTNSEAQISPPAILQPRREDACSRNVQARREPGLHQPRVGSRTFVSSGRWRRAGCEKMAA